MPDWSVALLSSYLYPGCISNQRSHRSTARLTKIAQAIIKPPLPLIKALMRNSQPARFLAQQSLASLAQEAIIEVP